MTAMPNFFCAQASRDAAEDPIANAENFQVYVLIECPPPWTKEAFDSQAIPPNLKTLYTQVKSTDESIVFLLICNEQSKQLDATRVIIFRQESADANVYHKYEFSLPDIHAVAPVIEKFLLGKIYLPQIASPTRDILICTHGSRDKCCAKYGNPFYRQAQAIVSNLALHHVRIWQVSHFGGHRFAPTAIDFPTCRYYARLDTESFTSILTQTGNIECINRIYRGWGILPEAAQVLEREMILRCGWKWFDYQVAYQIIAQDDAGFNRIELSFTHDSVHRVQADVLVQAKKIHLISYCDGKVEAIPQFSVSNLTYQ